MNCRQKNRLSENRKKLNDEIDELRGCLREASWTDFEVSLGRTTKMPIVKVIFKYNACNPIQTEIYNKVKCVSAVMRGFGYELAHHGDIAAESVNSTRYRATYYKVQHRKTE